jgi:hypothetical protein
LPVVPVPEAEDMPLAFAPVVFALVAFGRAVSTAA